MQEKTLCETWYLCQGKGKTHNQDTGAAAWIRRLYVHDPPTHTYSILPLFPLYSGYHREVLNVGHFLPPDRQSAPCSQPLSSHFTRSTRWTPHKLLFFPHKLFRLSTAKRLGLWKAAAAGEVTHKQIPVSTQTYTQMQAHMFAIKFCSLTMTSTEYQ